jgi:uncharacterized ferredoxin-like protein
MIISSKESEKMAVYATAEAMCLAARTAPKARGLDFIDTAIVTDDDVAKLAEEMERLGEAQDKPSFIRDAANVRACEVVVLIGTSESKRGLNDACRLCHFDDCAHCTQADGVCVYDPMDLGIAIGSAVSVAGDARADNRIMFSAGMAAKSLGYLGEGVTMIMGIPLSVTGKSIFFDR